MKWNKLISRSGAKDSTCTTTGDPSGECRSIKYTPISTRALPCLSICLSRGPDSSQFSEEAEKSLYFTVGKQCPYIGRFSLPHDDFP